MNRLHKLYTAALPRALVVLLSSILLSFTVPAAFAQATSGSLEGVVTDSSTAVIPGAEITATEIATGAQTKVTSNSDGIFSIPRLKPGLYTLVIQKQGFKKQEFQQVIVNIGQVATLDATLQAGQVTETVTVTAAGQELIQKEEVQISSTFDTRQVEDLPSNAAGGGIDTLALLAPGVVPGFGNVNSNGSTLSVNGNRARSNNFTIDGGDNNDLTIGGPSFFVDNADTVAEFQVVTNNFSAEYGRNQGAIVNIVTKSGTNSYHGDAAWYHRDANFLDALDNFQKDEGLSGPPAAIYNLWDGVIGGPIIKDRLFFFGSFEYITQPSLSIIDSGSPTIAPGALGALSANNPNNPAIQVLAHDSAFAFSSNRAVVPVPGDSTSGTVGINGVNYPVAFPQVSIDTPFVEKEFSVRGDFKITDKQAIWFRQFYQNADFVNALAGSNGWTGDEPGNGKLSTGQYTYQVSNTAVNEFRFVYNRLSVLFGGGCSGTNCIPTPTDILDTFSELTFGGVKTSAGQALQTIGPATNLPQGRIVSVYQFTDNFSKVIGRHELKFGADIRRDINTVPFLPDISGVFQFSSAARLQNNTPSASILAAGQSSITYNETDKFFYFQDNWKIKDNLTLNLGVRYENSGQPINTLHDISTNRESNPATAIWLQSLPLSARTFPSIPTDNHEWAPRVGFAWTPRLGEGKLVNAIFGGPDKSVISGGYSIAYDPAFYNILLNISTSSPLVFNNVTVNPAGGPAVFPVPFAALSGGALDAYAKANHIIQVNTFNPANFTQTNVAQNFYNPMSQQFTLRWQREFSHNQVFEARYVGTHGTGLFTTENGNPAIANLVNGFSATDPFGNTFNFPGFGTKFTGGAVPSATGRVIDDKLIRSRDNTAQSIYHSLQTRYQARMFNQLSVGVSYTFSKSLDNASEVFVFTESPTAADPFNFRNERGYSGFDRPNALSLNFIWDIPFYKDQKGIIGHLAGGWQFNGIYNLADGQRYTPSDFINSEAVGSGYLDTLYDQNFIASDSSRPFVSNLKMPASSVAIEAEDASLDGFKIPAKLLNGTTFLSMNALNLNGTVKVVPLSSVRYVVNGSAAAAFFGNPFGDAARGSLQGPLLNNLNLGLFKNIRLQERVNLQLRLEAFNAFNHPNAGVGFIQGNLGGPVIPDRFVEDAGLQGLGSGFANNGNSVEYSTRVLQVGVKVVF